MMFQHPPEIRATTLFTRLPDAFRQPDPSNAWAQANRGGEPADSFL